MRARFSHSIARSAGLSIWVLILWALMGSFSSLPLRAQASLTLSPATLPNGTVNSAYNQTVTATGGSGPYTFTVTAGALPGGVALAPTTGILSGTPNSVGPFSFTITATDSSTPTALIGAQAYSVVIAAAPLTLGPATLPAATLGVVYTQPIGASGGTGPYTFAITAGALPGGVTFSTAGLINGAPTAAGSFTFTVEATDSLNAKGSLQYTLVVNTITVNPASLPNGTLNTAYSQTISAAGGTAPLTFAVTSGALPGGLTLNGTSGLLSGTPNASGSFTFTITATDSAAPTANTGSRAYTLSIQASASPLQALSQSLTYGINVPSVAVTLSATGGTPPYRFAVTTQPTRGLLFGSVPTLFYTVNPGQTGQDAFTFTVTDALNASTTAVITITLPAATPFPTNTPLPTSTPLPTITPTPDPRLAFQTAVPAQASGPVEFVEARLVRPNEERNVDRPRLTFEWRLATGVLEYRLQVDNGVDFIAPVLDVTVRGGAYTIPQREPGLAQGIYYWRLAPVNTERANQGTWTEPMRFTVFIGKRPFDGVYTTDRTPRFTWSPVQGVTRYVIQISTATNFTTGTILEEEIERQTSYTVPRERQLPYGVYYWRVFPVGQPPIANVFYTLPVSPEPPQPPRIIEPGPDATVSGRLTTFAWEAAAGAVGYVLEISTNLEFDEPIRVQTDELTVTLDEILPLGIYIWRVRSVNEYSVPGNWSRTRALIVQRDAP